jgi:regulator of protease activity HflC (stomatin/prohibitin superfamily)
VFWFIIGLILILAGAVAFVVRARIKAVEPAADRSGYPPRPDREEYEAAVSVRRILATIGVLAVLGGLVTLFMDSYTIVPARNVGVVNTFGKADQALSNGWHWVKPWSSVETVDATVQNLNRDAAGNNCVTVRLANQTTACVDVTLQWNIDQHANANELWQRYRGTNDNVVGNVGHNVVERELQRALNKAFETYNPLAVLTGGDGPKVSTADLATATVADMRATVDKGIVVDTLLISVVHYDDVTQQKLNGYAQALADTQIATQQKLTAEQQRLANEKLATASSNDAGVKYQNCLNLIKDLAAKGQLAGLPATFNCGDGASAPVIVGQK